MSKLKLLFLLLAISPVTLFAIEPSTLKKDSIYLTTGSINLRDSPPKGIFYTLGKKTGSVSENGKILVKEVKEVKTLLGKHYWLNVEKTNPNTNIKEYGWIYGGKKGSKSLLEEVK